MFVFLSYCFLTVFFIGSTGLVVLVIFIELLSWLFVFFFKRYLCIKYLFIQRYFIIVVLFSILWFPSTLFLSLLLKIGLPPFQNWLIHFRSLLPARRFLFIGTIHKLIPLVLLGKRLLYYRGLLLISSLLIMSRLLMFQRSLFFFVLVCSSIVHSSWIIIGFLANKIFAVWYWVVYRLLIVLLLKTSLFLKTVMLNFSQGVLTMLTWLVISGIPPFTMFWLKTILFFILIKVRVYFRVLIVFSSVLALRIYFWAFHLRILRRASFSFNLLWLRIVVLAFSLLRLV